MRVGQSKKPIELKLGDMELSETDKYKYLGEINNRRMDLKDQITQIEGKVEAAYQTLLTIAEDRHVKNIKMEVIWKLVKTCITPVITYACETWEPNKGEMKKLNQILDRIIRRILMVPQSTPREALYIETGLLDIEAIANMKRLNMLARLNRNKSNMLEHILNYPNSQWMATNKNLIETLEMDEQKLKGTKNTSKNYIKTSINRYFKKKMEEDGANKTKIQYLVSNKEDWQPGKPAPYINHLTRSEASTIFRARTRMTQVKNNYKNAHQDQLCRMCGQQPETQTHILTLCQSIHTEDNTKVSDDEIFTEDKETLITTANKIKKIMELTTNYSAAPGHEG